MFVTGSRFEVKLKIKIGNQEFEPGVRGKVIGSVKKMVGKAYEVEFDDGRKALIHMVIMNNQTELITEDKY